MSDERKPAHVFRQRAQSECNRRGAPLAVTIGGHRAGGRRGDGMDGIIKVIVQRHLQIDSIAAIVRTLRVDGKLPHFQGLRNHCGRTATRSVALLTLPQ